MRRVGAATVAIPSMSTSPCWFTHLQANSIRWPSSCLRFAFTVAISVSPT